MPFTYLVLICVGGILLLSFCAWGLFLYVVGCTVEQSLDDTVLFVRNTFTETIEDMEPGKHFDSS